MLLSEAVSDCNLDTLSYCAKYLPSYSKNSGLTTDWNGDACFGLKLKFLKTKQNFFIDSKSHRQIKYNIKFTLKKSI